MRLLMKYLDSDAMHCLEQGDMMIHNTGLDYWAIHDHTRDITNINDTINYLNTALEEIAECFVYGEDIFDKEYVPFMYEELIDDIKELRKKTESVYLLHFYRLIEQKYKKDNYYDFNGELRETKRYLRSLMDWLQLNIEYFDGLLKLQTSNAANKNNDFLAKYSTNTVSLQEKTKAFCDSLPPEWTVEKKAQNYFENHKDEFNNSKNPINTILQRIKRESTKEIKITKKIKTKN